MEMEMEIINQLERTKKRKKKNEMEEERRRNKRMVQAIIQLQQDHVSSDPSYSTTAATGGSSSTLFTKVRKSAFRTVDVDTRRQKKGPRSGTGRTELIKDDRKMMMNKQLQPVDVTIKRDSKAFTVHIGSHLIEVTASINDSSAGNWARSMRHRYITDQLHGETSPIIVGFCGFRLHPEEGHASSSTLKGPYRNRSHPPNPYQAIAICLGGSHVLFHTLGTYYGGSNGRCIRHLKKLLNDRKAVIVGWGIGEMAKKIESQWGLKIARRPIDIRKLVAAAYRKDAIELPKLKNKGRVIIDDLQLESLAELALDGMQVRKKAIHVLQADWRRVQFDKGCTVSDEEDGQNMELLMYAARDAFLTYRIAAKCIERSGLLPK